MLAAGLLILTWSGLDGAGGRFLIHGFVFGNGASTYLTGSSDLADLSSFSLELELSGCAAGCSSVLCFFSLRSLRGWRFFPDLCGALCGAVSSDFGAGFELGTSTVASSISLLPFLATLAYEMVEAVAVSDIFANVFSQAWVKSLLWKTKLNTCCFCVSKSCTCFDTAFSRN